MSYADNARTLKREIDANRATVEQVDAAGGIRVTEQSQSDKVGYDWVKTYVNDILVHTEYVPQTEPTGTAENPIVWTPTVPLIPNAYYTHEGVRKVWMGSAGKTADWTDSRWEVW